MPIYQHRRGTQADLTSANEVYADGTIVVETDTDRLKIGDGVTPYSSLEYQRTAISSVTGLQASLDAKVDDDDARLTDARTPVAHNHNDLYYTETETDGLLSLKVNATDPRLTDARTPTAHTHDDRYYTEAETDSLLAGKVATTDPRLTDARTPTAHTHDDRYYTETEADSLLAGKASTTHTHDDRYYTESEVTTFLAGKAAAAHTHALSDLSQSSATTGQVPTWSGTAWVAATPASGGGSAFTGGTLTSQLLVIPGTASAPGLAIVSDADTGIAQLSADGANTLSVVTNQTQRMLFRADGGVGLGTTGSSLWSFHIGRALGASGGQILIGGTVPPTVTSGNVFGAFCQIGTDSGATATNVYHFFVNESSATRLGSVTHQYGFYASSTLTGGTQSNTGFRSDIPSGSNRYNFYAAGTASNYFQGTTGFGSVINAFAGTANSALGIAFTGDSDTGVWSPAADTVVWATGGLERIRLDASGRVGITTGGSDMSLYSSGMDDLVIGNGTGGRGMMISSANTDYCSIGFSYAGQAYRGYIQYLNGSDYLRFGTATAERMRIDSSGNVGIGTGAAAPASRLDVAGVITVSAGSAAAPALVAAGDNNTGLFFPAADVVALSTAGASRLRISADGSVGIGKTATCLLDVNGVIASVGGDATAPSMTFTGDKDTGFFSAGVNTIAVSTGGSERVRVDASGRVGIATPNPQTELHVGGTIRATNLTDGTTTKTITQVLAGVTQADIDTSINALVNAAPAQLDTLNELAAALNNDANFATTVTNQIAAKVGSSTTQAGGGTAVNNIVVISQAAYDALSTKDSNTVYLVT